MANSILVYQIDRQCLHGYQRTWALDHSDADADLEVVKIVTREMTLAEFDELPALVESF